jgi:hypothetical protein
MAVRFLPGAQNKPINKKIGNKKAVSAFSRHQRPIFETDDIVRLRSRYELELSLSLKRSVTLVAYFLLLARTPSEDPEDEETSTE